MNTHNRPNVTQAMSKLRFQYHMSLQEIGDLFSLSREAVRLRIGNSGRIPLAKGADIYTFSRILKADGSFLTNDDILGTRKP
jgi:hypothetical protein